MIKNQCMQLADIVLRFTDANLKTLSRNFSELTKIRCDTPSGSKEMLGLDILQYVFYLYDLGDPYWTYYLSLYLQINCENSNEIFALADFDPYSEN